MTPSSAATTAFKINFKLREIDHIEPWGEPGKRSLHWFGLTDGAYCFDTSVGRLLEHTDAVDPDFGEPWCEYQVVRLFEDLTEIWPRVSEPVPIDVVTRYLAWAAHEGERFSNTDDPDLRETWYEMSSWWLDRRLDFSYLRPAPQFHLWRMGADAHFEWRASAPWLPPVAAFSLPFESARNAVDSFFQEFVAAMDERVETIRRSGWQPVDAMLDIPALVAEEKQRRKVAASPFSHLGETDWQLIRARLKELGA
jgi:hypothetical protein